MRKAVLGSAILLGVVILITAAGTATLLWATRRSLDQRQAWVEAELRVRSARAAALQDLDWPPYREFLDDLRSGRAKSQLLTDDLNGIRQWRAGGCRFPDEWIAMTMPDFANRHWPFLFGITAKTPPSDFLREAPLVQDFFRGAGFESAYFRTAKECRIQCLWRNLLEKTALRATELDACIELVDRLEAARPAVIEDLEVEHLLRCRDVLRIYFTARDPEQLIPVQKPGWPELYSRAVLFSRLLGRLDDQLAASRVLASQSPKEIWRRLDVLRGEPPVSRPLQTFGNMNRDLYWRECTSIQRRTLLRTALAIARYGAATGTPPERLQDLVPKYLPSVPCSPLTGAPLFYEAGTVAADVQDHLQKWTVRAPSATR